MNEAQAKEFGADQPLEEREVNGRLGCDYQRGESAEHWLMFVATDPNQTVSEYKEMLLDEGQEVEIAGYPAVHSRPADTNCLTAVDVSDEGLLWLNSQSADLSVDPCQQSEKFAEAAIKNLDDAPGGQ